MLTIEVHRCNGCGVCVQVCRQDAISLVDGIARIDSSVCTECKECVDLCPTGAIQVASPIVTQKEAPAAREEAMPVQTAQRGALAFAAAALSLVGRYLLPKAADAIISVFQQYPGPQSGSVSSTRSVSPQSDTKRTAVGPAGRRQRHRGGR